MNKKIVVLAYSGGLDTSYCAHYLTNEKKYEVHTVLANTGGFDAKQLIEIEKNAKLLGVHSHTCIDITQEYYNKCIKFMIMGNVLKNKTYPLSVSSERAFQAIAVAKYAKTIKADYIAHGSTGAGNDQVRFDIIFNIIAPNSKIITPTRDLNLSREFEIQQLKKTGINLNFEELEYSINAGIWGTSIGGKETLTSLGQLPQKAYTKQITQKNPSEICLEFKQGELFAFNNKKMPALTIIQNIENLASQYGIGRNIHIGDTIIGTKGKIAFEAAAPTVILNAHQLLEKHTLSKWQLYWNNQIAEFYGMLLHEAQYLEPCMRDMETYLINSQQNVSGKVFLKLCPQRIELIGIESNNDLMNDSFGQYGEKCEMWSGEDVKGFTNIISNSLKIYHTINNTKF